MDDIWSAMKADSAHVLVSQKLGGNRSHVTSSSGSCTNSKAPKKKDKARGPPGGTGSVEDLVAQAEARELKAKKAQKKAKNERKAAMKAQLAAPVEVPSALPPKGADSDDDEAEGADSFGTGTALVPGSGSRSQAKANLAPLISAKECLLKLARDVQAVGDLECLPTRRSALQAVHDTLFVKFQLSEEDYGEVFSDICKPVFKRFADPAEKCRELALRITTAFFQRTADLTLTIGYFFPALLARAPPGLAFDEDMKVFVSDMDAHEAYRRGKAVDRQDKGDPLVHTVVEPAEEMRLLACTALFTLVEKLCALGASTVLHPYFHDVVLFTQSQLRDPYPAIKGMACELLELLCLYDDFTAGMKFFSVALCRQIFPVMRHRHAKVRSAAVSALMRVMAVPDRAKCKGAGTEAIMDLVGFKEENHLSVAAFYKAEIQINYLADVAQDSSVAVRMKVAQLLHCFLTELPDRYDHQTRLIPYCLDLLCDPTTEVSAAALATITRCGQQYEDEHQDEIIERRQYGVDGDRRMNLDKPLPAPFTQRPRLGQRLYVRGNCKRFLVALVSELTNWVGTTRLKSANLLKMVVVFTEEHLTMEAYTLLPAFIKALGFARDDSDRELEGILLETYELAGRFIVPDVYLRWILPRLSGDPKVAQFGVDSNTRVTVMMFLAAMLEGSASREIAPLFEELVSALTDPFTISQDSPRLMNAAISVLRVLLDKMAGRGKAAVEAHFLNTGRLGNLRGTVSKAFRWLCSCLASADMRAEASKCMTALAQLDRDSIADESAAANVQALFSYHGGALLQTLVTELDVSSEEWEESEADRALLSMLIGCPWGVAHAEPERFAALLRCLADAVTGQRGSYEARRSEVLAYLSTLLQAALLPVVCSSYRASEAASAAFIALYGGGSGSGEQWTGVKGNCGAELSVALLQVLRARAPLLAEVFSLHDRWAQSRALRSRALHALALLLGLFSDEMCVPLLSASAAGADTADSDSDDDELTAADVGAKEGLLRPADVRAGHLSAPKMVSVALDLAQHAASPLGLRLLGVRSAAALLQMLVRVFDDSEVGRTVKPFTHWAGPAAGAEQCTQRAAMQAAAEAAVASLLRMLADSSDAVRAEVVAALGAAAPLVRADADAGPAVIELDGSTSEAVEVASGAGAAAAVAFTGVSAALLKEVCTAEAPLAEQAEAVLRSLAVLDPAALEAAVEESRGLLPSLSAAQRAFKEEKSAAHEALSGLSDHCGLLQQFATR